jgi:hypothetical protein
MKRIWLIPAAVLITLVYLVILWNVIAARAGDEWAASAQETPGAPHREVITGENAPAITFVDSPDPTCYRARPGTGICYITWSTISVAADSGQNIISMTVSIDGHIRAYQAGFFQNSMTVPGAMYGPGLRVACGWQGDNPSPNLGQTYAYIIRARESDGQGASNYGSVTCPADESSIYLPLVRRD